MNIRHDPHQELSPTPIASPDYITAADFIRPVLSGASCGLVLSLTLLPLVLRGIPLGMELTVAMDFCIAEVLALIILAMSLIYMERAWLVTLAKDGPSAFERFVELPMPYEAAFELCLAATGEIKNSRLLTVDEEGGLITLKARPNFFARRAYLVEFRLKPASESRTAIKITSELELSQLQRKASDLVWGAKWSRLLSKVDVDRSNQKLMDKLEQFVTGLPNWDHSYCCLPGDDTVSKTR